jgi:hypothetical protein
MLGGETGQPSVTVVWLLRHTEIENAGNYLALQTVVI